MNRKMFNWIRDLVTKQPDQTTTRPSSAIGHSVIQRYHCGYVRNDRLLFSAQDKLTLRQRVKEDLGIDPYITRQLPDDRLEMARFHNNEKLAGNPVSHDFLLVNSPSAMLRLNKQQIPIKSIRVPSAGLFCLSSGIESVEHQAIVVVENLPMMAVCNKLILPPLAQQALWVYRGDHKTGSKTNVSRDFILRFGDYKKIIVFSDMDPKGLEIALTMPFANYWLGPEETAWSSCLQSRYANRSGFDLQHRAMTYLQRKSDQQALSESLKKLLANLQTERSSYRQEHMYGHKVALDIFPLT